MATATPTSPEALFSYTMKDPRGDLFTVRGNTWDEFTSNVENVLDADNVEKVLREINDRVAGTAPAPSSSPAPAQSGGNGGGNAPANWQDNPPVCSHGTMRAQQWTAKSGPKAGQAQYTFFCPLPREAPAGDKCQPIDALTRKAWGGK